MESSIPWFFWLFPIAFTLHNIEEAIWMPAFSKTAGRFQKPVGRFEFVFALIVLTLLALIITVLFFVEGKQSVPCYLFFAFNFGMLVNVFFPHVAATVALKRYCPGLLTGILLLVPVTLGLLLYGYGNAYFYPGTFWLVTPVFAALVVGAIPLLFRLGRSLERLVG